MEQPSMTVTQEVTDYVEREIIPHYTAFDKAHREDHVRMVIRQSLRLAAHFPALNTDMVYVVAAFHDLGLAYGRENHHRDSRKILESDAFVRVHFTPPKSASWARPSKITAPQAATVPVANTA